MIKFDVHISGSAEVIEVQASVKGCSSDDSDILPIFKSKTIDFFNRGERVRHGNQKLTEDQVREIKKIRREKGWGRTRLARKFNVGKTTIERIISGATWKDIE
jgi:ribosome-binding protein aMBF1 (putative translation factor)